jgi:hypothetical protein
LENKLNKQINHGIQFRQTRKKERKWKEEDGRMKEK